MKDLTSLIENKRKIMAEKLQRMDNVETVKAVKIPKKLMQIMEIANETVLPDNYYTVWTEHDLQILQKHMEQEDTIAVDTETTGLNCFKDHIVGFSVWLPKNNEGYYVPIEHVDNVDIPPASGIVGLDYVKCLPKNTIVKYIKPVLENKSKKLILHHSKYDVHILHNWLGIDIIDNVYFDTMIAAALLDENKPKNLKDLSGIYLKEPADKFGKLFGRQIFSTVPILLKEGRRGNLASYYAIKDTYMTYRLYKFFNDALDNDGLARIKKLFYEVEMPFLKIVYDAEQRGVKFDSDYMLNTVAPEMHKKLGMCMTCNGFYSITGSKYGNKDTYFCTCENPDYSEDGIVQKIWRRTGEINLKSPEQLGEVLYKGLKFPKPPMKKKKPKINVMTGKPSKVSPYCTDKKTLKKLKAMLRESGRVEDAMLIDLILEFRAQIKLVDAFVDKLPKATVNGRVHTSFQSIGCVTGRMSSSMPKVNWAIA